MVAMLQTSLWLDNQSNRNHPADQLQLILIFSFAANQKLMFQTGDAGCLCFKSFTLEDAFIWKKGMWFRYPSDKQWRPSTAQRSEPNKDAITCREWWSVIVHPVCTLRLNSLECTLGPCQLSSMHLYRWAKVVCYSQFTTAQMFTKNKNIQSNCVKAGAVVQVEVVQVCQAAGRLKSDRQTTYLPAPPVLACVLCTLWPDFSLTSI